MSRRLAFALATLCAAGAAPAQQLKTYTQSQTGPQFLTYGLPVPLPIESLTPVDGFRSYDSVQARLQALALQSADLSAHDVGRSFANRTVWAYIASDADDTDVEGRPEAAFFINASTHAREWGTPEVSTGTIERLVAGAGDGGIVRYVLDNTRLVIIPVQNVDGVLQTQRYPTDVLVGQDPDVPSDWPRDGRMRRKNMRGVDEVLTTTADHLFGVDLNRNHPPFWATNPERSSTNPASLVHHGSGPHSEPENQALLAAARLAPETRLRLGIDLHSFSRVFYSSNTARTRLNTIQRNLISVMADHHEALSGARYDDVPDPANRGIGAAAEYFGYQWLVPSWTLELEPRDSAFEYGGTNVTHGGFILPAAQARRVRESWAETHLVAFYRMAGPPHLARVRYVDALTGATQAQVRWQWNAQAGRRERVVDVPGPLVAGRRYRVELGFSKPMRYRNAAGQVAALPGTGTFPPLLPVVTLVQGAVRTPLDIAAGAWLDDAARVLRYRDDTFAFEFSAPANGEAVLEVSAQDMTGLNLDADPSTAVDWEQGAWSEFENIAGLDGDLGGADRTTSFATAAAPATQATVLAGEALAGEGDRASLRVSRAAGSPGRLELRGSDGAVLASWAAGEAGERTLVVVIPDDVVVNGDRELVVALTEFIDGAAGATLAATVRVLDNDEAGRAVWRVNAGGNVAAGWNALVAQPRGELVLSGATTHAVPTTANGAPALASVTRELVVHGNAARVEAFSSGSAHRHRLIDVAAGASLTLDHADIDVPTPSALSMDLGTVINAGTTLVRRTRVAAVRPPVPLFRNLGALAFERSALLGEESGIGVMILQAAGDLVIDGSSLLASDASHRYAGTVMIVDGGTALARNSSLSGARVMHDASLSTLQVQASIVDEAKGSDQIHSTRQPCARPVIQGLGSNVFTADYGDGDEGEYLASQCFTLAATDVFDPAAHVAPDPESRSLLPLPVDWPRADRVAAAHCAPVDVRGAPRPQERNPGIVPPRCDAGSHEIGINPYRGIWSPARSGHGVDIQTTGNRLFLAWYTYEDDGEPTAYQAVAPFTGPHWEATLQQSRRNPQTGALSVSDVGTVSLDFADATHATLGWRFTARGTSGSEAIAASLFAPGEPRFEVTGLWYPPAETGHGATISRRGEVTAVGVYYYDAEGNVRWALGTGTGADAQRFAMTSFRGFCPDCSAAANPVTGTPAGTALVHFQTPLQARVDLQLTYPGAAGGQWNRANARFVPLGDPVDNRDALRPD